jgi:hypothetical protein
MKAGYSVLSNISNRPVGSHVRMGLASKQDLFS